MKIIAIFGLLASITLASPADADYYKYKDKYGNVIYTDDVNKVPANQKSKAKINSTVDKIHPPAPLDDPSPPPPGSKPANKEITRLKEQVQLDAVKEALDQEFESLLKENARLKEEQKTAVAPEAIKAVNKKAVRFNTRFKAYQEKKAAYNTRLEAFKKGSNPVKNQ